MRRTTCSAGSRRKLLHGDRENPGGEGIEITLENLVLQRVGNGRHNDVKREMSGIFHATTGANIRLKAGQILDVNTEGIDVYSTMLEAVETKQRLGSTDR